MTNIQEIKNNKNQEFNNIGEQQTINQQNKTNN